MRAISPAFNRVLKLSMLALWASFATSALASDAETCMAASGDEAIAICSRAIASGKFKTTRLGELYRHRGHEYFTKVFSATERLDEANLARAIADFDASIKMAPDTSCFTCRCSARTFAGQLQGALADCNEALRRAPKDVTALTNRGFVYFRLGQFEAAIRDFSASLRSKPKDNEESLYGRGLAKQKSGDETGGDADIAAAKATDAKVAESWVVFAAGLR
jgi:tetratricopeptide (TPR) repeat protein